MVSVHHLSFHLVARLFFSFIPHSSRRASESYFFFHRRFSSRFATRSILLSQRRPSSFFHPLGPPGIYFILSRPERVCQPLSPLHLASTTHLSHPPVAHRRDYGIFFHPRESALLGCSTLTSNPVPTFSSDEPDLSHRHPCVTLRRQTPISDEGEEGRRTKLHRDRSREPFVYIYNTSRRGRLSGESSDGNSIRTVCISF